MNALAQRFSRIFEVLSRATYPLLFTLAVLFSVTQTTSAQTFQLLYQFRSGNGGSQPYASLIRDSNGNLYGTAMIGGAYSYGTVFKISPAGTETVLHSFKGTGGDGASPGAPLVRDAAGNLYGTTLYGGGFGGACRAFGCGTVFKVTPAGKEIVLYRFTGAPGDGMNPWQGLVSGTRPVTCTAPLTTVVLTTSERCSSLIQRAPRPYCTVLARMIPTEYFLLVVL
jgi:uncharacterized repeat protein (TIGR03803 family)